MASIKAHNYYNEGVLIRNKKIEIVVVVMPSIKYHYYHNKGVLICI